MAYTFSERLSHAWNAFKNRDPTEITYKDDGVPSAFYQDRVRLRYGNDRSIIASLYNRIAMDVADTTFQHVRTDDNGRFLEVIDSDLNRCLSLEANIDQTSRDFFQSATLSMFDEGVIAIVPIDTTLNPRVTGSFDVRSMRVGKITQWYPRKVKVLVYNDQTGQKEEKLVDKNWVGIVNNPFYSVMNEPNSTLRRLIGTMNQLDAVNEQSGSGKLDLIIQLPYIIKTDARRDQANKRRKEIEDQLSGSKYGIAYTDGTEKITQLNRPVENNLMKQVEYLTSMLYSQLGMTEDVFNGTASNEVLTNYFSRTIEPIVSAFATEIKRKFLTKTAISQHQSIYYFRDPFRFVPVSQIAEIADKFTRNEIMTSNEVRQIIGMKSVENDPRANQLLNKNITHEGDNVENTTVIDENQNGGNSE